jgi:hypothetical protein
MHKREVFASDARTFFPFCNHSPFKIDGVYGHPVVRLRVFEEKDGDLSVLTSLRV